MEDGVKINNLKVPAIKGDTGVGVRDLKIQEDGDMVVELDNNTTVNAGNINKILRVSIVTGQLVIETTGGETYIAGDVYDDVLIQSRIDKFNSNALEKTAEFQEIARREKEEIEGQTTAIYGRIEEVERQTTKELEVRARVDETGNQLALEIDNTTYIMTLKLLDKNSRVLDSKSIDFPLEQFVIGATLDATGKNIILTLKNGNTVSFSVADLVSGLVSNDTFQEAIEVLEKRIQAKFNAINEKLDAIEGNAQANIIERILVNGIEQPIVDKTVDLEILGGTGGGDVGPIRSKSFIKDLDEESVVLNNSADSKFKALMVEGFIKQKVSEGTNLLDISVARIKEAEVYFGEDMQSLFVWNNNNCEYQGINVTVNSNGSVTVNGTYNPEEDKNYEFYLTKQLDNSDLYNSQYYYSLEPGTYYFTYESDKPTDIDTIFRAYDEDKNNLYNNFFTPNKTIQISSNKRIFFYMGLSFWENSNVNNVTLKFMISKEANAEWQPYGISPSPNYPSDVNGLGKNTLVKVSNGTQERNYSLNFEDLTLYEGEIPYIEGNKVYYDKKWEKYIFTGNENYTQFDNEFACMTALSVADNTDEVYSNYALSKYNTLNNSNNYIYAMSTSEYVGFAISLENAKNMTVQEFKAYIKSLYDNNSPLYIVYKLKTLVKTEIIGELAEQIKNLYQNARTYKGQTQVSSQNSIIKGEYYLNNTFIDNFNELSNLLLDKGYLPYNNKILIINDTLDKINGEIIGEEIDEDVNE